ncbi:MAG: M91 family zinc metallopeptidase [Bacteroidales bacterium]|nr:M91 family zinc metallopeptidase [Bacteroidales bacterium]
MKTYTVPSTPNSMKKMNPNPHIPPLPTELSSLFRFFSFWAHSFRYFFTSTMQETVFANSHYDEIGNFNSYLYSSTTSYIVTPTPMKNYFTTTSNTACSKAYSNGGLLSYGFELGQDDVGCLKGAYRFGFNAQEKVDEIAGTGNHYTAEFWEYSTRIVQRWNVDPKRHPAFSPYSIMQGNPIWYCDPYGDTIRINYTTGEDRQLQTMTYTQGMEYDGDNEFLSLTVNALNKLNSKNRGAEMISELHASEKDITINQHVKNIADGLNVGFNPYAENGGMDQYGGTQFSDFVSLGHEMAHVWDEIMGTINRSPWISTQITQAEKFATHIENQIRAEHNLPLRKYYGLYKNDEGFIVGGFGQLIRGNESLFYFQTMTIKIPTTRSLHEDGRKNRSIEVSTPYKY